MEGTRPVCGYEGIYEVDDRGQVRRILPARRRKTAGHILKPTVTRDGYLTVRLYLPTGEWKIHFIQRVVALAFHGPMPGEKYEVNHKNGIKADNRPDNLEWVTRSENLIHANRVLARFNQHGEGHHKTYFVDDDIREIRRAYAAKEMGQVRLARRFGTTQATISRIIKRQTWAHIT